MNSIKLKTYNSEIEANIIKGKLESQGIMSKVLTSNQNNSVFKASVGVNDLYDVIVGEADFAVAQDIINELN